MNWLLLVVLNGSVPNFTMQRFPNQESCDSIKVWIQTYSDVRRAECLPDIEEPKTQPQVHDIPESDTGTVVPKSQ